MQIDEYKYSQKMSTIQERVKQLIDNLSNGNKRAFAIRIGVSPTVIENVVGQRSGKPGAILLEKILCSFENIDALWLITGKGEMLKPESPKPEENLGQVSDPDSSKIIGELTEVIRTQAKALLEQQQFINAHFSRNSMDSVTPPLTKGGQYADK